MTEISAETIQRMWTSRLVIYAVVLVVVAALLTLILRAAREIRTGVSGDLDRGSAGREQHDPHRAARHDEPRRWRDPRLAPRAIVAGHRRAGRARRELPGLSELRAGQGRRDECPGRAGRDLGRRASPRCSWRWRCSCVAIDRELEDDRRAGQPVLAPVNYLSKIRLGVRAIERQTDALAPQVTQAQRRPRRHPRRAASAIDDNLAGADRGRVPAGAAMSRAVAIPDAVYTIWWVGLIVTLVDIRPARRLSCCTARGGRRGRSSGTPPRRCRPRPASPATPRRSARWTRRSRWPPTCSAPPAPSSGKLDTVATVLEERGRCREAADAAAPDADHGRARRAGARGLSDRDRLGAPRHAAERGRDRRRARGRRATTPRPCPRSSPPSTARWARCSAGSRRPTAMSGARPACSGCPEHGEDPMCFKNLPIEFDAQGKPYLRAGVADPYAPTTTAPRGAPDAADAPTRIEELLQAQRLHQGPGLRSGHAGRRRARLPHRGRLQGPQGARGALGGDAVPRLRGDHDRARSPRRDLHHQPRVRRLRRRAFRDLGDGHRDGDRLRAAAARHPDPQPRPGAGVPLRPPAAPAPAGRPRLLGRDGRAHQPVAAGAGAIDARRPTPRSTASGRWAS